MRKEAKVSDGVINQLLLRWIRNEISAPRILFLKTVFTLLPKRVDTIIGDTRIFFVVGMGRSGTLFLSHLLNKSAAVAVYHEAFDDRSALVDAYWKPSTAFSYLSGGRKRLIAARIIQSKCEIYGEVNSYLRYHVEALSSLGNPLVLHLARDGRNVVRSIMNRKAFTQSDEDHTGCIAPHPKDPMVEKWTEMDRFQKACWYWASANRHLLQYDLPLIRFEDIISSYEYMKQQVLQPLNLILPFTIWQEQISRAKNASKTRAFPAWRDWDSTRRQQFETICGAVMSELGYF